MFVFHLYKFLSELMIYGIDLSLYSSQIDIALVNIVSKFGIDGIIPRHLSDNDYIEKRLFKNLPVN